MTDEQKAAYIHAQAAAAMIEAMGMFAANQERIANGYTVAYDDTAFSSLINKYGIAHNSICTFFHEI